MQRAKIIGFIFSYLITTTFALASENSFYNDEEFFDALRTCDDYTYTTKLTKNDYYNEYYKSISKDENGVCRVILRETATQLSTSANAINVEAYNFPLDIVKNINKYNFDSYAAKYIIQK